MVDYEQSQGQNVKGRVYHLPHTITATFHSIFLHLSLSTLKVKQYDWLLTPVGITCSLTLRLLSDKSLQWIMFFSLTTVSYLPLVLVLFTSLHHAVCVRLSLCSTVCSHLSVQNLCMTGASWPNTDRQNLALARSHGDSQNTCIYGAHTLVLLYLCQTCYFCTVFGSGTATPLSYRCLQIPSVYSHAVKQQQCRVARRRFTHLFTTWHQQVVNDLVDLTLVLKHNIDSVYEGWSYYWHVTDEYHQSA